MSQHLDRRRFLCGLALLGAAGSRAFAEPDDSARLLPQRKIPSTGEPLPVVGLGSTKPVRRIAEEGTAPLRSVLDVLLQHGGKVVDTSPRPVEIDRIFGQLLREPRFVDGLFLAAKVKVEGKKEGIRSIEQTRRLFGRETLDLVQIESMTDYRTHWPTLRDMQDRGKARYVGVTVAHERLYEELATFMAQERPDFVQLNYSVMEPGAEERLLPMAADLGIAVLVNGPFMNGEYFGLVRGRELPGWAADFDCETWAQFSLKYILAHPAVTCVLTETTNPGHMAENIRAALGELPGEAARARMRVHAADLRSAAGGR